jgi:hypothetical protein
VAQVSRQPVISPNTLYNNDEKAFMVQHISLAVKDFCSFTTVFLTVSRLG